MRVARLHGPADLRVDEESIPGVPGGWSLVCVTAVGICGSDLHWYAEGGIGDARLDHPLVPGHEAAGVIADGPRRGERVAIDPAVPCRACESCAAGHPNLCPTVVFAGHGDQDGALREYLAWPDTALHPLPDAVSDVGGAMLEPLGVAIHALDLGHLRFGASVAVVGCGPIGLLLVQLARAAGASRVIAVEPLDHRREAAVSFGADVTDAPCDVVFEVAGTDEAVEASLRLARPGARVVLVGIPSTERTSYPAALARRKGLTLVMARRMGEVYPRAIDAVRRGAVDVDSLVSARYPLEESPAAFRAAHSRAGLKTVVLPAYGRSHA